MSRMFISYLRKGFNSRMFISYLRKVFHDFTLTFVICFLLLPTRLIAAEVLQVRSSLLLQIGDHNRIYTVQLACLKVDPSKDKQAKEWLISEVPRHRRVNLRPEKSENGILFARVIPLNDDMDLSRKMDQVGLGHFDCLENT